MSGVVNIIRVIGGLSLIVGLFIIFASFTHLITGGFIYGLASVIETPFIFGFAYIVEAACRYLEVNTVKTDSPHTEPIINKNHDKKKLSDDERLANLKVLVDAGSLSKEEYEKEKLRLEKQRLEKQTKDEIGFLMNNVPNGI